MTGHSVNKRNKNDVILSYKCLNDRKEEHEWDDQMTRNIREGDSVRSDKVRITKIVGIFELVLSKLSLLICPLWILKF
jgi:hypothetical protein